jgi:hypothetical protein
MKLKYFIVVFCLSVATSNLFGQTNHPAKKIIRSLNAASQNNIEVIASGNMDDEVACPPEFTNIISNTNLFTLDEQKLLNETLSNYINVRSNIAPIGSVLVSYRATPLRVYWGTNWQWVSHFQFTNSDLSDEVSQGGDLFRHKVRNKAGDGFDFNIVPDMPRDSGFGGGSGPEGWFQQIKHGVKDGLSIEIVHGDHCSQWMRYSNGMAVDKWLIWDANKPDLILWAKFKEPYDISRFQNK